MLNPRLWMIELCTGHMLQIFPWEIQINMCIFVYKVPLLKGAYRFLGLRIRHLFRARSLVFPFWKCGFSGFYCVFGVQFFEKLLTKLLFCINKFTLNILEPLGPYNLKNTHTMNPCSSADTRAYLQFQKFISVLVF